MKKIIASTLGLMMVGGAAASAVQAFESQFGGYWRTRGFYQSNFTAESSDYYRLDNRTRLYYTAKFTDDFKFVNKFEFNSVWGDDNGGDIGADGDTFRVKNSYVDFTSGNYRTKLGIQGTAIARGFIFDDDFSGVMVTGNYGNVAVTPFWIAVNSEDGGGYAFDRNMFGVTAAIKVSDAMSFTPYFVYDQAGSRNNLLDELIDDIDNWYLGTDFDMKLDAASIWATAIYNSYELRDGAFAEDGLELLLEDDDGDAYLGAIGVDAGIAHGQAFYASGDDAFISAPGQSYYWSEILGLGVFDGGAGGGKPAGSPGGQITNIWAVNAGVTLKPMDKLKIDADVWYAMLAEDDLFGEDELGLEFDGKLTYALADNMNVELILAYLVAGDAVLNDDNDVFEGGVRVSLKF